MKFVIRGFGIFLFCLVPGAMLTGCATAPKTEVARDSLHDDAMATISHFRQIDPSANGFLNNAHGYAVFPNVGKGAAGVGGAYGKGVVYRAGQPVGYCDVTQGTVGLQLGGQAFSEIIVFESAAAMEKFQSGQFALAANASAVALKAGAAASAAYDNGVAVFVDPRGGLMAEAAVGGQKFNFKTNEAVGDGTARIE